MEIPKILTGEVLLYGSPFTNYDYYNFYAPNPNTLQNTVLNEVYLQCDTTAGPIYIYLPLITTLGGYETKIFISDIAGKSFQNIITVIGGNESDLLNQNVVAQVSAPYASIKLEIASNNTWLVESETSGSAYNSPIYQDYPFVVTPSMITTGLTVSDNPYNAPLTGYKVGGMIELGGESSYSIYVGSVEQIDGFAFPSWKLSGAVTCTDGGQGQYVFPLGNCLLYSDTNGAIIQSQVCMYTVFYSYTDGGGNTVNGYDLYLTAQPIASAGDILIGFISFEYEFLSYTFNRPVNFIFY